MFHLKSHPALAAIVLCTVLGYVVLARFPMGATSPASMGRLKSTALDASRSAVEVSPTARPAPSLPKRGAASTGNYRNLFQEAGYADAEISDKVQAAYDSLFGTGADSTIYYETGSDMAYIKDVGNNDIRTEGVSYGLMITVQMNDQARFNRLWKFAKTYMQCPNTLFDCGPAGQRDGYFAWDLNATSPFQPKDSNPASDGEAYITTALLFAAGRWGNGSGIFDYQREAQIILDAMLRDSRPNGFRSLFNLSNHLVVFSPDGQAANYTNPSYHLPAFYEVWARHDANAQQRAFWHLAAIASRDYWRRVIGSRTNGLMPDCTDFNGTPTSGCAGGPIYSYDAWRAMTNVAVDYAWWAGNVPDGPSDAQVAWVDQLLTFFSPRRPSYANQWNLNGTPVGNTTNSSGQIAMNAAASLAGSTPSVWDFVSDLWQLPVPTGQWRYYDGSLYMLALLHLSGKFRVYRPPESGEPGGVPEPTIQVMAPTETIPAAGIVATASVASSTDQRLQASTYTSQAGTTLQLDDELTSGKVVALSGDASYLAFSNVDLGTSGPASIQIQARTVVSGVNVVFHTESPNGPAFCTLYPPSSGNWEISSNTCYPKPTGLQSVYVTVTGPVILDWFQFSR